LIRRVGWKIAELREHKQVRLENLLTGLSSRRFMNSEDLMNYIKASDH